MSTDPLEFPPFVPAKPKGGVAASKEGDMAVQPLTAVEVVGKSKRKRRTAAEIEAAGGTPRKKKLKPRPATIPLESLTLLAGLTADEIDQVVGVCEAINTFPKAARKRIAAAIGQLFR